MSWTRTLMGLWKNHEETSEHSPSPKLRTPYYNIRKEQVIETVLKTLSTLPDWSIIHKDLERGEIMVEKRHPLFGSEDIVISVYGVSGSESALDIVSAKRGAGGDFGSSYRNITTFLNKLHKEIKPK
ncbi:DUF1499 domain-containing protein [Ammoniphilus sp. CFH 90114]|uniref:DUF1499 domain-containing protein n=1 Tax=Ammoniphilus sp. CFH 90114 TaxID=2493665 RepID=UPI00100EBC22|nr:DUF1499 domain-containing protein [Ammoniphilus sp. CFH 90114]RXT04159.1 DUF1499 domain-containing protein [Ammoniphilus sp. CFH 90114]